MKRYSDEVLEWIGSAIDNNSSMGDVWDEVYDEHGFSHDECDEAEAVRLIIRDLQNARTVTRHVVRLINNLPKDPTNLEAMRTWFENLTDYADFLTRISNDWYNRTDS